MTTTLPRFRVETEVSSERRGSLFGELSRHVAGSWRARSMTSRLVSATSKTASSAWSSFDLRRLTIDRQGAACKR